MIGIGLKLSAAGVGDYWDDVDKWIRNQFAENQLMDTRWVYEFSDNFPLAEPIHNELYSEEDVIERNRGAFAGWAMPNAWMGPEPYNRHDIMHCCTANGARALYYIWEHILHHDSGHLRVNLLLNRASRWADVNSQLPYRGQVDIRIKRPIALDVRIPGWVDIQDVTCTVDSVERSASFHDRYLHVGQVQPGDVISVRFSITEIKRLLEIEKRGYGVTIRGADIVEMKPSGVLGPFYERDYYRTGETRWRRVDRFVTDKTIAW